MSAATVKKNRESTLKGGRWWKEVGWRHIVAIAMIIYCLVPLLYVLSVSLNPGATLTGSNSLFSKVSLDNFTVCRLLVVGCQLPDRVDHDRDWHRPHGRSSGLRV